jgi:ubiquinone/menaquinone biosynthesis C-methylase UbiE
MDANQRHWDSVVSIHTASEFYDVASFKGGQSKLKPVELEELGDVRGKSLLHLQCHFGMDTLSWARHEGAIVTGADFSLNAIEEARALAADLGIDARFVHSNIYNLPQNLDGQFDVVFTSYGVLGWLPDLARWAEVSAAFVKPGGTFYIVEFHPFSQVFDESPGVDDLHVRYPYFETGEPLLDDSGQDYADPEATFEHRVTYWFPHPLAQVVTSLIDAGLRIEFLHEFPFSTYQFLPFTQRLPDGTVRLLKHDGCVPLLYSIKATKPAE